MRDPLPRWRRVFPGRDDQVREVRRWLAGLLPATPERDDLVLVAVELVTNAIQHTASGRGGLVLVEVAWCGPVLRVAVGDDGAADGPRLAPGADPGRAVADPAWLAERGRGLRLVGALAVSAGVCGDHRGRLVWADIAWTGAGPDAASLPPPRSARHRPVPGLPRPAADEAGHGHAEPALAVIPATRAAAACAGA